MNPRLILGIALGFALLVSGAALVILLIGLQERNTNQPLSLNTPIPSVTPPPLTATLPPTLVSSPPTSVFSVSAAPYFEVTAVQNEQVLTTWVADGISPLDIHVKLQNLDPQLYPIRVQMTLNGGGTFDLTEFDLVDGQGQTRYIPSNQSGDVVLEALSDSVPGGRIYGSTKLTLSRPALWLNWETKISALALPQEGINSLALFASASADPRNPAQGRFPIQVEVRGLGQIQLASGEGLLNNILSFELENSLPLYLSFNRTGTPDQGCSLLISKALVLNNVPQTQMAIAWGNPVNQVEISTIPSVLKTTTATQILASVRLNSDTLPSQGAALYNILYPRQQAPGTALFKEANSPFFWSEGQGICLPEPSETGFRNLRYDWVPHNLPMLVELVVSAPNIQRMYPLPIAAEMLQIALPSRLQLLNEDTTIYFDGAWDDWLAFLGSPWGQTNQGIVQIWVNEDNLDLSDPTEARFRADLPSPLPAYTSLRVAQYAQNANLSLSATPQNAAISSYGFNVSGRFYRLVVLDVLVRNTNLQSGN